MRLVIKSGPTASQTSPLSSFLLANCAPATENPCMFLEHATLWCLFWKCILCVGHCSPTLAPNIHLASSFSSFRLFPSCQLSEVSPWCHFIHCPYSPHFLISLWFLFPCLIRLHTTFHPTANSDFASVMLSVSSCSTVSSTWARISACLLCSCSWNNTWHIVETD